MTEFGTFAATVGSAFVAIFLAELGDKTQLLALGFGAKYRLRTVFLGALVGFATAGGLAALVGGVAGSSLPQRPLAIVGGLAFIGFAIWTLIDDDDEDDDDNDVDNDVEDDRVGTAVDDGDDDVGGRGSRRRAIARSGIATIAIAIAIGELGDKTQLATAVLAAQSNPFAVWIGATAGEVTAAMVGAVFGNKVASRLSPATLRYASAALFALFGVVLLWSAR